MKNVILFLALLAPLTFTRGAGPTDRPDWLKQLQEWDVKKVQPPAPPADPAGFFGLRGKVKIGKASVFVDGGTIFIELMDEHGVELVVFRRVLLSSKEPQPVGVHFRGRLEGKYFLARAGAEERALLALLQQTRNDSFVPDFSPANAEEQIRVAALDRMIQSLSS
ncbi:MAG TPA: hypothetical protein VF585_09545 [Chthoniobacterales bacterium]|jgi:hypothetical protein